MDRQVIKTTPARLWSLTRQQLVEIGYISFLPSKQSRLHRKQRNETTLTKRPKLALLPKHPKKKPETKEIML